MGRGGVWGRCCQLRYVLHSHHDTYTVTWSPLMESAAPLLSPPPPQFLLLPAILPCRYKITREDMCIGEQNLHDVTRELDELALRLFQPFSRPPLPLYATFNALIHGPHVSVDATQYPLTGDNPHTHLSTNS